LELSSLSNFTTTTIELTSGSSLIQSANSFANFFLSIPQFFFGGFHVIINKQEPPKITPIQCLENINVFRTALKVVICILPVLIGCSFRLVTLLSVEGREAVKALDQSILPKREMTLNEALLQQLSMFSSDTALCRYSLYAKHPLLQTARNYLEDSNKASPQENRAIATLLGLAIGDVQGAPYEFLPWKEEAYVDKRNSFGLSPGQWTDDTSMSLCLADALDQGLVKFEGEEGSTHLDQNQLMGLFRLWWNYGYNNAFRNQPRHSVGLGGNISQSFHSSHDSKRRGKYETTAGDLTTSGNGAAMRNSPVAIVARSPEEAMKLAWEQSKVTHQGHESALCCQVMAFITYHAIHSKKVTAAERLEEILGLLNDFRFPSTTSDLAGEAYCRSVLNLVQSHGEWNWKGDFKYNSERLKAQPGYIGSYVMDGLAMALHCLVTTNSFEEAIKKAGHRGGDADSVAAILGQLAGPIYGLEAIPSTWIRELLSHDGNGEIACRALALLARRTQSL